MALTPLQIKQLNNSNEAMRKAQVGTLLDTLEKAVTPEVSDLIEGLGTLTDTTIPAIDGRVSGLEAIVNPPVVQTVAIDVAKEVVTISYNQPLYNAGVDAAALKAGVTFAADGATFGALAVGDGVAIENYRLIVTFASAIAGAENKIMIAADTVMNGLGIENASYTSEAIDAS